MSNIRTVEKKITWRLELTEKEDELFRRRLEGKIQCWHEADEFFNGLLMLCPKEGDDEKNPDSDDDLDFDLSLDDFDSRLAIHAANVGVPMGSTATAANIHGTMFPKPDPAVPSEPTSWTQANQKSNVAQRTNRPGLDASSTDANLTAAEKLRVSYSGRQDAFAEDGDKLSYGPAGPDWYDPPRGVRD